MVPLRKQYYSMVLQSPGFVLVLLVLIVGGRTRAAAVSGERTMIVRRRG